MLLHISYDVCAPVWVVSNQQCRKISYEEVQTSLSDLTASLEICHLLITYEGNVVGSQQTKGDKLDDLWPFEVHLFTFSFSKKYFMTTFFQNVHTLCLYELGTILQFLLRRKKGLHKKL